MRDLSTALWRLDMALERLDWLVKDVDIWFSLKLDENWYLNIRSDLTWAERWTTMAENAL
jgi:hypothetical protein